MSERQERLVKRSLVAVIGTGLLLTAAHGCSHQRGSTTRPATRAASTTRTAAPQPPSRPPATRLSIMQPATTQASLPAPPIEPPAPPQRDPAAVTSLDDAMRLLDDRADWTRHPEPLFPRHPAEKHLKGLTICIDPGHGGGDGANGNAGPTGVREKDMNLRVGLLLERLLKDAGATVVMTRTADDTINLEARAAIANRAKQIAKRGNLPALPTDVETSVPSSRNAASTSAPDADADAELIASNPTTAPLPPVSAGADLFVSIHHNTSENRDRNFSSVWYHAEVDQSEASLDAGRHIGQALGDQLRTQVALTSPLLSDQLMYPTGFGVLRAARVPSVLLECSFYTNRAEERRLADAAYNLREAYAIYTGLCQWAYEGRPTQPTPTATLSDSAIELTTTLSDGLPEWWGKERNRIVTSTIDVTVDGKRTDFAYDLPSHQLRLQLPNDGSPHIVSIHFANLFKHHNWPQRYEVTVVKEDGKDPTVEVKPLGEERAPRRAASTRRR